jgi:hypothetical protein
MDKATVTLPLHEYNRLKKIEDEVLKALQEKRIIVHRFYRNSWGTSEFTIVNETEAVAELSAELAASNEEYQKARKELLDFKEKVENKRFFNWFK